ncbi:ribonuclease HI [Williamsia sterculiae]|uniref:Ribonuclease H n=1 Tax=Williamsia sterculiae TaxID=1344003 RepID=A0A1N7FIN8_9NOCA|nr:ribonuclease HI [Williamsia sterculiae]SIS00157.1 ribonuclease HI [Williamsia sterculiae]
MPDTADDRTPVEISTDGACLGNPGPGGWGAVLRYKRHEKEISGAEPNTTNNRMELTAAIRGLEAVTAPSTVILYTDSTYVRNGITKWVTGWQSNGWMTKDRKPVKNAELWRELVAACERHDVEWRWVKGHAGDHYNEIADRLATAAARTVNAG